MSNNHHIQKDILFFISLYDDYIENNILYFLGLLKNFNISVYYSNNELLISYYKNKNTLLTQEIDVNAKNSIFSHSDLSIEISCDIDYNKKFRSLNLTNYYVLFDNENQFTEDFDDGIIISNAKYSIDFYSYNEFKVSLISNISREIINSKNRLENFNDLIENQNANVIVGYYNTVNLYKKVSFDIIIKEESIKIYATEAAIEIARKIINGN